MLRQAKNDADGTDGTNAPLRWDSLSEAMREWKAGKEEEKLKGKCMVHVTYLEDTHHAEVG